MVAIGDVLNGRFELERVLGQGGFGRVFLSTDRLLRRQVAIKTFNPELTSDPDFLPLFEAEAQTVATLEHQHILTLYDYGQDAASGTIFLVMPYILGGTLAEVLRRDTALPPERASGYLRQAAMAVDYAHRRHVVHRDIKPQNMLLRAEDDHLLLADFGIAKVLSTTSAVRSTRVVGTLAYMAPEQIRGHVGHATDVYALGCVLFHMLAGAPPYAGPTEQVMYGHLMEPVPSVADRSGGRVPATFQPVLERALAKEPAERFASARALAEAFGSVAGAAGDAPARAAAAPTEWAEDTKARATTAPATAQAPTVDDYAAAARAEAARRQAAPPTTPATPPGTAAGPASEPRAVPPAHTAGQPRAAEEPRHAQDRAPEGPQAPQGSAGQPTSGGAHPTAQGQRPSARIPWLRINVAIAAVAALLVLAMLTQPQNHGGQGTDATPGAGAAATAASQATAAVRTAAATRQAVAATASATPAGRAQAQATAAFATAAAQPAPAPPTAAPPVAAPTQLVARPMDNLADTGGYLVQEAEDVTVWVDNQNVGTISVSRSTRMRAWT